jgi:uncharacterized protein DUF1399
METKRLTTKPTEEVLAAIQTLNLESVKTRLMDPKLGEGWTRDYADSIEQAYKTFLCMATKHQEQAENIMLSKDVDEFWHTHILQTMKYADDCEAVFGTFLHHAPHIGELTEADHATRAALTEKTRKLYESEFGDGEQAEAAWAGRIGEGAAAVSSIALRPSDAAVSSIAIRASDAAVSSIAIREHNAAVSSIAILDSNAAVSSIAIRESNAAVSSIAIRASNAAVSSIAIQESNAAVSSIAIREDNAAVSSIAIRASNAAVSSIAIRSSTVSA